jgi:hypothetical protein
MILKPTNLAHPAIGRELRVSELKPDQTAWVRKIGGKHGDSSSTVRVLRVLPAYAVFHSTDSIVVFFAKRTGENLDRITDDSNCTMHLYEYKGKP